MKKLPSLGEQEMDLLRYLTEHSPASVRDVADHFEKTKGLARTTVLTVMERLRKKGLLTRSKSAGIFQYSAKMQTGELLSSKVSDFVEKTLGGSVSPLIAYFINSPKLTREELDQLQNLARKIGQGKTP